MDRSEEIRKILTEPVSVYSKTDNEPSSESSVYDETFHKLANMSVQQMIIHNAAVMASQTMKFMDMKEVTKTDITKFSKIIEGMNSSCNFIREHSNTRRTDVEVEKMSEDRKQLEQQRLSIDQQKLAIEQRKVDVVLEQNQLERARLLYSLGNTTDVPSDVTALLSSSSNSGSAYYKDKDGSLKPLSEEALAVDE